MEDYVYFIYVTENKVNGKLYIGQHHCRYSEQFTDGYLGSGTILLKAIKKYGAENFERIILEYADSPEELNVLEAKYVDEEVMESDRFYNVQTGGRQCFSVSAETRMKISKANKGRKLTPEAKEKLVSYNRHPFSEERKRRISESNKGKTISEETRRKISKAGKGRKPWNKGVPMSDETKEKQRIVHTGKAVSLETRRKVSEAVKKWWQTRKLSMTVDGSPNIEE